MSLNAQSEAQGLDEADFLVEEARSALLRLAKLAGNEARTKRAYALALEVAQLRRPEVVSRLDAERLTSARSHA